MSDLFGLETPEDSKLQQLCTPDVEQYKMFLVKLMRLR